MGTHPKLLRQLKTNRIYIETPAQLARADMVHLHPNEVKLTGKGYVYIKPDRAGLTMPQKKAIAEGAVVEWVDMGYLSHTMSKAVSYVNQKPKFRKLVPFGIDHPTVMASFIRVCGSIDYNPSEVWVVGGSGTLSRGLQLGWPDAEHNIVSVGHKLQSHESLSAKVYKHPLKFDQVPPENELPPYPSVANYDAKVWKFVKDHGTKGALIWNVA